MKEQEKTPVSSLFSALKNISPILLFFLVGAISITLGVVFFNLWYEGKEIQSWESHSFGEVYDKKKPMIGPLPYGLEWSKEWQARTNGVMWKVAFEQAMVESNKLFLKHFQRTLLVRWKKGGIAKVRLLVRPAPAEWYAMGQPCEPFKVDAPKDTQIGDLGRFIPTFDRATETLKSVWIGVCDKKADAAMLFKDKLDKGGVGRKVRELGRDGILIHEFFHGLVGYKHPSVRCQIMCSSPRGKVLGTQTIKIIKKVLKIHSRGQR